MAEVVPDDSVVEGLVIKFYFSGSAAEVEFDVGVATSVVAFFLGFFYNNSA